MVEFIALKQDVTRQIAMEEHQSFLAASVEHSVDAVFTCTMPGVIRSWNTGAQAMLGYSAGEIVGRPIVMKAS